ncbi:hypothetical protein [Nocardioides litoris]|uniref:hypothetical protein n=1 Tax=Nocardioides litoris TaxID=1926648 RepID=UPI00111F14BF|nr:hypothetical protein [Nocardioides litoris]
MTSRTPTRRRPSPLALAALAVSVLSLLVAVGASSYAAGLARGSVGTVQLRTGAVSAAKIKAGAVTGPKIRSGAVTGAAVRDGSIGRADLGAGVLPPRPTYVRRTMTVGDPGVRLAAVNGVGYDVRCQPQGGSGALAVLDVAAVAPGGTLSPLTATFAVVRRDAGSSAPEVSTAGASDPFSSTQLLSSTAGAGSGQTSLSGVVQYLDRPPARVDLGLSAVGGSPGRCRVTVLVEPLG